MSAIIAGSVVVFVLVLFVIRRRRKTALAGLNSDRPQYAIEPPLRSMTRRSEHRW